MSPIKADKLCMSPIKPGKLWRPTMKASKLHHLDRQTLQLCRFTVTTDIWAGAGYWIPDTEIWVTGTVHLISELCWFLNYCNENWVSDAWTAKFYYIIRVLNTGVFGISFMWMCFCEFSVKIFACVGCRPCWCHAGSSFSSQSGTRATTTPITER